MKVVNRSIVYDNPMPHLRSRQAMFPFFAELDDGTIVCCYQIGEAFESVDGTAYASFSKDGGKTWSAPVAVANKPGYKVPTSDSFKPTSLGGNKLVGLGYEFFRENPENPLGNAETGGVLPDRVFLTRSEDGGKTWSAYEEIHTAWDGSTEASAPITVLQNGDWVSPITGFPNWDGKMINTVCGRMLRSTDEGKTWNDDAVCMSFEGNNVTCFELRLCQLESGALVTIGWNENMETGERMNNHYTISYDNGKTWSAPMDTGIRGQASGVFAIGGEKLLALHACRRDTDRPGIYAYVVDLSDGKWNIVDSELVWEPDAPITRSKNMAEIFAFLKFGQPGAIKLKNGNMLMSHWFASNGQYMVAATEIEL